jgi:hypothetical protein
VVAAANRQSAGELAPAKARAAADGNIPPHLQAEVVSNVKHRQEGVRIKHWVGLNSIKMYDKHGNLWVEATINDVDDFRTFRAPENKPDAEPNWQRMRKGVADPGLRRGRLCTAARRSPKPPTTATSTAWPRSRTPPHSGN